MNGAGVNVFVGYFFFAARAVWVKHDLVLGGKTVQYALLRMFRA